MIIIDNRKVVPLNNTISDTNMFSGSDKLIPMNLILISKEHF